MKDSSVGKRVFDLPEPVSCQVLEEFRGLEVPNLSDAQAGHGVMSAHIGSIVPATPSVIGPALTVSITPGNGTFIRRAIELARPRDILVVNGYGNLDRAVLGGNILMAASAAGIGAVIIDGAVRDVDDARRLGMPLYARGLCARSGSDEKGVGEIGGPVACGGVAVLQGDVVVIDEDGLVVIPRNDVTSTCRRAWEIQAEKGSMADFTERLRRARNTR